LIEWPVESGNSSEVGAWIESFTSVLQQESLGRDELKESALRKEELDLNRVARGVRKLLGGRDVQERPGAVRPRREHEHVRHLFIVSGV
jgi:hypothetical protein